MEHEFRAMELAEMMPSQHAVQLAIKYASRLRMLQLAQRLNEVRQVYVVQCPVSIGCMETCLKAI